MSPDDLISRKSIATALCNRLDHAFAARGVKNHRELVDAVLEDVMPTLEATVRAEDAKECGCAQKQVTERLRLLFLEEALAAIGWKENSVGNWCHEAAPPQPPFAPGCYGFQTFGTIEALPQLLRDELARQADLTRAREAAIDKWVERALTLATMVRDRERAERRLDTFMEEVRLAGEQRLPNA